LASTTANKFEQRSFDVTGVNFANESPNLQYLANAGTLSSYGDALTGPDSNVAIVARAAYSYDDRYFVTASWRRDYASRLPKDKNYGDFPAFTAAWKVSNEKFFERIQNTVNLLKIRASWGRVGNLGSIGYNYKSNNLATGVMNEQAYYGAAIGSMYGTLVYNSKALNRLLTWETSEQFDLGIDLALFNSRLDLSIDYFNKRTFNLIQEQTTGWPNTIGVSPQLVNQGEIKNKGLEIQAGWNDKIGKHTNYYVKGNFTWLNNKVTSTGIVQDDGTPGVWSGGGDWRMLPWAYQTCVGGPLNQFYIIKTNGIIKNDADLKKAQAAQPNAQLGDLWFVDANNDNKIDEKDRQYCGSATPKYTFALSGGFTWKNLSVDIMFQGVAGSQIYYPGKSMILSDVEGNFNRSTEILNAWSPTNTGSDIPRLSKNDPNGNWNTASDYFLEKGDYIRLKNLTVGYDFTSLIRKCSPSLAAGGTTLSAYISGENLFTITKYSGMDPECGGFDTLTYPMSRVISIGVKLNLGCGKKK
ncbi:MAG: SusC/RagA family TonB-linked outer membrane protein, partial [Bacteroidaceae bacterium]|nr:SusC/RagA family TonB-linked outer membrane protein [Bacteroidaceae bacterium]